MEMTVEAFILCWNEEKMIRHTLNHYEQFCDKITIIDNESTDQTLNILKTEYPEVIVKSYSSNNQIRDDYYQHLKNTCWYDSKATWAIVCDMDELLYHPDILNKLLRMHSNTLPKITGYNMFSKEFPSDYSIPITEQIQYGLIDTAFDKQIIFNPQHIKQMNFSPGAHRCFPVAKNQEPLELSEKSELSLLHYKYLSKQYVIDKHDKYAARLSRFNQVNGFGAEYLKGAELIKKIYNTKFDLLKVIQ